MSRRSSKGPKGFLVRISILYVRRPPWAPSASWGAASAASRRPTCPPWKPATSPTPGSACVPASGRKKPLITWPGTRNSGHSRGTESSRTSYDSSSSIVQSVDSWK
ncbi:unnamed protein product [Ascophyllum nodosum]